MVDLHRLRHDAVKFDRAWGNFERMLKNMTKRFRDVRNNEHMLTSRNKREGYYSAKALRVTKKSVESYTPKFRMEFVRIHDKAWALRYRKQTGAQVVRIKERK
jgi:hypothetical protein